MIEKHGKVIVSADDITVSDFTFLNETVEGGCRAAMEWAVSRLEEILAVDSNFTPPEIDLNQAAIEAIESEKGKGE